jgi:hypothetical protein
VALARRLHRATPVRRSEYTRARVDIAQLAQSWAQHGTLIARQRFASAPALALLAELSAAEPEHAVWPALHAALQSLLDARRRQSRLPVRASGSPGLCKFADAADWADDHWYALAVRYADDGRGRLQWYDRTAAVWDATQAAVTLERQGILGSDARVLMIGDLRRAWAWSIAATVRSMIVADVLEQFDAAPGTVWLDHPERFALNPDAADRLRAVAIDALDADLPLLEADVGVLLPWSDDMSVTDLASLATVMRRHLRPHALMCVTIPVRLAGPPDARVLDGVARVPAWLAAQGLELIEPIDTSLSDEGLLAATDSESRMTRTPNLLVADGPRLIGRLFVAARTIDL